VERDGPVVEEKPADGLVLDAHRRIAELDVAAGRLSEAVDEVGAEVGPALDPRAVLRLRVGVDVGDDAEGEALEQRVEPIALRAPVARGEALEDEKPERLRADGLVGVGAATRVTRRGP
jgi:hypothetical protein